MDDRDDDRVYVTQHLASGNTQRREPTLGDDLFALLIVRGLIAAPVYLAVDLDCEPDTQAGEINAVRVTWKLVAKFEPAGALAELPQQQDLGKVLRLAIAAGGLHRPDGRA